MVECCNAPRLLRQVSSSYSLLLPCHLFACHAFHIMSSCASHLHTCSSHASENFPRCPFCIPAPLCHPVPPFCLFSCAGVKRSWIGPRLANRRWFTTDRPPVKSRAIWNSFDTPTVNRGTVKASCVLQPNTLSKWPNNPSKPPPSSRSFDHDRVAESRTSFGLS